MERKRWQPPRPLQELLLVKMGSASYTVSSVGTQAVSQAALGWGTLEGLGLGEGLGWDSATPSSLGHSWSQGQGEGTWVLPRSLHTKDTHWLDARKLSVAGRGGPPGWEVWQLEERTTFWGLHAPFSTLLTQPIKLLTMCQNLRHNALGFLGVSSMFPLSRLTPKAE